MNTPISKTSKICGILTKKCGDALICVLLVFIFSTAAHCGDGNLLTPEERTWLNENRSRIVLAVETGYPPFVFLDSKGKPCGLAHDYLLQLESKLGVNFLQKQFPNLDEILSKVRSGEVQIVNAVTKTPVRSEFLAFSEPFITVPNVIIVRKERSGEILEKNLSGLKVSLVKSYAITEYLSKAETGIVADIVPSDLTAILNVSFGQSDAAVIDLATASYLISQKGITNLRVAGEASRSIQLSMAVPHSDEIMLSILQKGLNSITEAERRKIRDKWIPSVKGDTLSDRRFWVVSGSALFVIISLLIGSYFWNTLLRRQVALHTGELAKEKEALRQSESRHRAMVENITDVIAIIDENGINRYKSPNIEKLFGWRQDEVIGHVTWKQIHPDDLATELKNFADLLSEANKSITSECRFQCKDGSYKWIEFTAVNLLQTADISGVLLSYHDITERKCAENTLVEAKAFTENALNTIPDIFYSFDLNGRFISWNKTFSIISGYSDQELSVMSPADFFFGDDLQRINVAVERVFQEGSSKEEAFFVTKDGRKVPCEFSGSILRDSNGTVIGFTGIGRDISARKLAEEEKLRLESQLHQAQKMESVGSLAGGVAHDFNNKLSVILGHVYLAQTLLPENQPVRENLEEIRKAAEQSADLTRQLLAFARKQAIAPKVLELNETVTGMLKMLNRLIGEDIRLTWQPAADLWLIKFDPSQMDQILANLCVNARDSISDDGKISIATGNSTFDEEYCSHNSNALPGEYVRLVVSDNGCGMTSETLSRIFEPFFTTKDPGKGTGLGLATVFGIVKQNNGFINVYSEPGTGTAFTIYLPRYVGKSVQVKNEHTAIATPLGHETLLLVEDELAILTMASKILTKQGYTVLQANTTAEAISFAKEHVGEINLLITDVIMPGMNGKALANVLQSFNPLLKCLYMSGYTADAISQHGVLDDGVNFIQKPFSLPDLAIKVRAVLDGK